MASHFTSLLLLLSVAFAKGSFDRILISSVPCSDVCNKTYPLREKETELDACERGCRFFSIIEQAHDSDLNETQEICQISCAEAYPSVKGKTACLFGCKNQLPFAIENQQKAENSEPKIHLMYPLMYVHGLYTNMIDKVYQHMSVSWSFYMQADNGQLVVIRSKPQIYLDYMDQPKDDYQTSNYLETNIESVHNGATPLLKNSQMYPGQFTKLKLSVQEESQGSDWLACISRKTGLPHLLLTGLILLCAIVMIWLCLTAANTAPDHKIQPQKLSIYGDLDYLMNFEKKGMRSYRPQDTFVASPLPVKIKVDRI